MVSGEQKRWSRRLHQEIARLLLEEWDPIGVRDVPECRTEYNTYVGGVHRLLVERASDDEIVDHLKRIEVEKMGLPGRGQASLFLLTKKLRALVTQG